MQLSAEFFEEILHGLRTDHPVGRNQRSAPRVGVSTSIEIYYRVNTASQKLLVRVRDVSSLGIGFLSSQELRDSQAFAFRLARGSGGLALVVTCKVEHCERVADRLFLVGASFTESERRAVEGNESTGDGATKDVGAS